MRYGKIVGAMSGVGEKQTFGPFIAMSALPPKAHIAVALSNVRFVPEADIMGCQR